MTSDYKFRKLKIYSKGSARTYDMISVPEIRLEGKWLLALGFKEGEEIAVYFKHNKLIITPMEGCEIIE